MEPTLEQPQGEHVEAVLWRPHDEGTVDQLDVPGRVSGQVIEQAGGPAARRLRTERAGTPRGHPDVSAIGATTAS